MLRSVVVGELLMGELSRLSRCLKGETPETARHFRDSGTVQMSHSSVTGVRSKSFIQLWISGKYSLENHFSRRISMLLPSLSCTFRSVPGMSSPFCFHWMRRSAISMWAFRCSSVAYRWRMSLTVMLISSAESVFFHSS